MRLPLAIFPALSEAPATVAESTLRPWWARFRGHLEPAPCPYSDAAVPDVSARSLVAVFKRDASVLLVALVWVRDADIEDWDA